MAARARLLPGFQRRHRYALSGQDAPKQDPGKLKPDAKQEANTKPDAKPEQLDRFGRRQHPGAGAGGSRSPTPTDASRQPKARAGVRAATPSGWRVRARRPTAPSLRMARRRCRPRPTASPAASRSWASAAGPASKSRRADEAKGDAAKDDAGKTETAKTDAGKTEPTRPRQQDRCARRPSLPSERQARDDGKSETAKVDAAKDSGGASRSRCGPIRFRRSHRRRGRSTTTASGTPEPAASPAAPAPAAADRRHLPAVTASAPPPPPAAPAGPPAPPISR